jgi:WD40 repeat protein
LTKRVSCWYSFHQDEAGTIMVKKDEERPEPKRISIDKDLVEPEIPVALLTGPSLPEGLKEGWYQERPPLALFARVLADAEAKKVHWTVYPNPKDAEYKPTMDYEATIIELLLKNTGAEVFKTEDTREFLVHVSTLDEPSERISASNYNASSSAKNWLGKDNVLTKALDQDVRSIEIPPGGSFRWLFYFTNYNPTKSLVPEMICRVYAGDWPMWPVRRPCPPPGVKVPAEGLIKITAYRVDKNDPHYSTPQDTLIARGVRLEGTNEWGDNVEFFTEHPIEVPENEDTGFGIITAYKPGDDGLIGIGVLEKYSSSGRAITAVTNPLATWDVRQGPPKGQCLTNMARRRWLMTTGAQRPLVAAEGERFAVAVENFLWVFNARGDLLHTFDAPWYPYSLCFGRYGKFVYMGHDNTLVEFDLERGKSYDLQELAARIENLAMMRDGTILALGEGNVLMRVDTEGRTLGTWEVVSDQRVLCAKKADTIVVWNGYAKFQVLDMSGKEIVAKERETDNYDGIAISPDGKYIAVGEYNHKVSILDVTKNLEVVASWPTIGLPHAIAFHPTEPIVVAATRDSYLHAFHLEKGPIFS